MPFAGVGTYCADDFLLFGLLHLSKAGLKKYFSSTLMSFSRPL
jgi:hypothetical protein